MAPELKSALLSLFIQYLLPIIFSALAMLAGWALLKLAGFLDAKGKESKLAAVGARIAHLAETVVADLEATLKPELLKATADGELTKAEVARLRDVALDRLKQLAGERGLLELKAIIGIASPQLDAYLNGVIEAAVSRLPPSKVTVDGAVISRSP